MGAMGAEVGCPQTQRIGLEECALQCSKRSWKVVAQQHYTSIIFTILHLKSPNHTKKLTQIPKPLTRLKMQTFP